MEGSYLAVPREILREILYQLEEKKKKVISKNLLNIRVTCSTLRDLMDEFYLFQSLRYKLSDFEDRNIKYLNRIKDGLPKLISLEIQGSMADNYLPHLPTSVFIQLNSF